MSNSSKAIVKQSQGKRYVTQADLVEQIKRFPGDTRAQASWRYIGGSIVNGQCVPVHEFAKYMLFFNATRRLVELTSRKENRQIKTGRARCNAHAEAAGLYPIDANIEAICKQRQVKQPVEAKPAADPVDVKNMMNDWNDYLT